MTPRNQNQLSLEVLAERIDALACDVEKQTQATKELVAAWSAAHTLVTFVKWGSTLVTALALLWAFAFHGKTP